MNIEYKEVLRYLGYTGQKIENSLKENILKCMDETIGNSNPQYIYRRFNININNNGVELENTDIILPGNDIKKLLSASSSIYLMAVTLGSQIDRLIKYYEYSNMTKALIINACAADLIEKLCNKVESYIKEEITDNLTMRYSPGYGDLPLNVQTSILTLLNAQRRIGITLTDSMLMVPKKSVTAILGVGINKSNNKSNMDRCKGCRNYKDCVYRKAGKYCGI